jgi:hypothetical protein
MKEDAKLLSLSLSKACTKLMLKSILAACEPHFCEGGRIYSRSTEQVLPKICMK